MTSLLPGRGSAAPRLFDGSLKRRDDWRAALHAAIAERLDRPFAWGRNDGAMFTADLVLAMTGVDLAAAFRGRYRSERGAARVMRAAGYTDLVALVAARLPEIQPSRARSGDVAIIGIERPGRKPALCLGLFDGGHIRAMAASGAGVLPFTAAVRAFRV